MNHSQRQPRSDRKSAGGPDFLRRLRDALDELAYGRQLVPVPIPVGSLPARSQSAPRGFDQVHFVFGRRRDESSPDDAANSPAEPDAEGASEAEPQFELPPPPSAADATDGEPSGEEVSSPSAVGSTWTSPAADEPSPPSPFSYDATSDQPDLPAWAPSPLLGGSFPTFDSEADTDPAPWGGEPVAPTFDPQTPAAEPLAGDAAGWPGATVEPAPLWSAEAPATPFADSSATDEGVEARGPEPAEDDAQELVAAPSDEEMTVVTELEEFTPFEPESIPEVVAVSETSWSVSTPEPATHMVDLGPVHPAAIALVEDARAFPLPEGEVLFRNLRSGFTDPARLLRHLAGEGHTGVMHVAGADERNTYIVLVDGYVVAVATDDRGKLTTTNRVAFPNFPNSQDVLNVIIYPREIARGLGLLLHAPVHFRGLAAMFVNLDGLRSYLSKHAASGGLVVQSDTGTGVALFDDGRLVGVYSGSEAATTDLEPLRELIKDLDAEIDVRFGGPKELDPVPLDTLLAGYPL